jgi:putative transposase
MARLPRLAVAGQAHLVAQRGHGGGAIFLDDADRQGYLRLLHEAARNLGVAVHGYRLDPGEAWLLLTPATGPALSELMQALARRHGLRVNQRHGRRGTLWEGRFRAAPLQAEHWVLAALAWLEASGSAGPAVQPAGPAGASAGWSSAAHHLGQQRDAALTEHPQYWKLGNTPFERELAWRHCLAAGISTEVAARLTAAALSGWPVGDDAFLEGLSRLTERRLAPKPRGRPARAIGPSAVHQGHSSVPNKNGG